MTTEQEALERVESLHAWLLSENGAARFNRVTAERDAEALRTLLALATRSAPAKSPEVEETFQARVKPWMDTCFGEEISSDRIERGDRLLEEVFELLQSGGYDETRVAPLRNYVWNRPAGEPSQEVGGVMVTLAAYCLAHGLDMHQAGETELARIWTKVEAIRAKQAAKPTGSALTVAPPEPDTSDVEAVAEVLITPDALQVRRVRRDEGRAVADGRRRWRL